MDMAENIIWSVDISSMCIVMLMLICCRRSKESSCCHTGWPCSDWRNSDRVCQGQFETLLN